MPRPLVFSNGSLFVGIDDRYRIRDLFYPHVGLFNHLSGHSIRTGVWVDGKFSWTDDDTWERELGFETATLTGKSLLRNANLGIELSAEEGIPEEENRFVRLFVVRNLRPEARDFRVFFTHDLRIAETDIGDTAFVNPFLGGIVHYKGPHWFLFRAFGSGGEMGEYATGTKGFGGMEGTWRDAEDGRLSMNPIAQGSVDSTFSVTVPLPGSGSAEFTYEILAGKSLTRLQDLATNVPAVHVADRLKTLKQQQWDATDNLGTRVAGLPDPIVELAKRSLLILEAMSDRSGAILAATDSDIMETARANYCYCWPRDGAHIGMTLDRVGRFRTSERFFRFCAKLVSESQPFLLQKYRPDGTLGATWHPWLFEGVCEVPFQQDESASVLLALGQHLKTTPGSKLLGELYEPMVRPMASHMAAFRDPATGLPLPSYDLWEERRGIHTYTAASVFAGLSSAAEMAERQSDPLAQEWRQAAEEVREGILGHLIGSHGRFLRRLEVEPGGRRQPDDTPDSSTLWVGLFGVLELTDPFFELHMRSVWDALWVSTPVGGLARYKDDYYFRASQEVVGNPWVISTMWLAQCLIARAEEAKDLEEPLAMLHWAAHYSGSTQVLPEQIHPHTGRPLSVSPLTWSHAEYLKTVLDYAERSQAVAV